VRLIQKTNGGQASAFNAGIPEAQGKIVAFLDGDDWWAKEKISVVMDYLAARPHIGVVGHGIYEVDSDTGNTNATIPQRVREISFDTVEDGRFFRQMMCFFGTSRVTIRRDVVSRVLPVPEQIVVEAATAGEAPLGGSYCATRTGWGSKMRIASATITK
jgi:glycosyltransferase involved in cell wall biosynthesis